jgi:type II secretory pathway component PulK
MKLLTNQKGIALIIVMIVVVVVVMLTTTVMMMLVNEMKGNSKVIESAQARYEVEGMIEENVANIHQQLGEWIKNPIIQSKLNSNVVNKSLSFQNIESCRINGIMNSDPFTISFKYVVKSNDSSIFDLNSITFPNDLDTASISCSKENYSIKATVKFTFDFNQYKISDFRYTELVRE